MNDQELLTKSSEIVVPGFKFLKTKGIWKGAHCHFDGVTGWSYGWYCVLVVLPSGKIVFNSCQYSNQTARDISRMRRIVGCDSVRVYAPSGLQNTEATRQSYEREINKLETELNATGRNKVRNREDRLARLEEIKAELETLAELEAFFASRNN